MTDSRNYRLNANQFYLRFILNVGSLQEPCILPISQWGPLPKYGYEVSNLKISKIIGEFFAKHVRNFSKRIFYNYYLRDMSLASIELPVGLVLLGFDSIYGGYHWMHSAQAGIPTPAGTVMLSALPTLVGIQLLLGFIGYDVPSVPVRPAHRSTRKMHEKISGEFNEN